VDWVDAFEGDPLSARSSMTWRWPGPWIALLIGVTRPIRNASAELRTHLIE
jgi:hypothetical protein